jgi:flagellar operon protein
MNRDISSILPVTPLPVMPARGGAQSSRKENNVSFQEALQREIAKDQGVKISAHAERRLKERNIVLAQDDLDKINQAVKQAESKGARESLIIYGDLALITSVRNKTIVTAMDGNCTTGQVFTNIDSAVIVK